MFADWELIGVPHRVTVGERGLKEGVVEYVNRRNTGAPADKIKVSQIAAHVLAQLEQ